LHLLHHFTTYIFAQIERLESLKRRQPLQDASHPCSTYYHTHQGRARSAQSFLPAQTAPASPRSFCQRRKLRKCSSTRGRKQSAIAVAPAATKLVSAQHQFVQVTQMHQRGSHDSRALTSKEVALKIEFAQVVQCGERKREMPHACQ